MQLQHSNALNYRRRFSMPGYDDAAHVADESESLWYSFDVGNTHLLAYDTEVYFQYVATTPGHGGVGRNFGPYPELAAKQLAFVRSDLAKAAADESVKWIVAFGHRPMYCSNNDDKDCTLPNNGWKDQGLEQAFYENGVDVVFEAHEHSCKC
jgi:hypothetical protein